MPHSHDTEQQREREHQLQEIQGELLLQFPNIRLQFLQELIGHIEKGRISVLCARNLLRNLQQQK